MSVLVVDSPSFRSLRAEILNTYHFPSLLKYPWRSQWTQVFLPAFNGFESVVLNYLNSPRLFFKISIFPNSKYVYFPDHLPTCGNSVMLIRFPTSCIFNCGSYSPGTFCQKWVFLDILVVFRLDFGQISFNLVEKAFATQQFALLAASIVFYDILDRAFAEIKISMDDGGLLPSLLCTPMKVARDCRVNCDNWRSPWYTYS